jgi:hypothetical protein
MLSPSSNVAGLKTSVKFGVDDLVFPFVTEIETVVEPMGRLVVGVDEEHR